jgi:hypothetical protein
VTAESVATILEREAETTIQNWLGLVEKELELTCISLTRLERTGHLPKLLRDVVLRLRLDTGLPAPISLAARDHGKMRFDEFSVASRGYARGVDGSVPSRALAQKYVLIG